jgi:hypothetical protein
VPEPRSPRTFGLTILAAVLVILFIALIVVLAWGLDAGG